MRSGLDVSRRVFVIICLNCEFLNEFPCGCISVQMFPHIVYPHDLLRSYLKPLFAARGIKKGIELEGGEVEEDSNKKTPAVTVVEEKPETKVLAPKKGLFGRMFGRKRSLRAKQK